MDKTIGRAARIAVIVLALLLSCALVVLAVAR